MLTGIRRLWRRAQRSFPVECFYFDRPLVLLQSDDWGRVGLRDRQGLEQLRSMGMALGDHAYDSYTLETAEDLAALATLLARHHDSTGRAACLGMNFVVANVDFARVKADGFGGIALLPLSQGLPEGWVRPGLFEAYREGIAAGVYSPGLHGTTHFCRPAVERHIADAGERGVMLRTLWTAGTPYIYWRMPWIGYENWDPEPPAENRFLGSEMQRALVGGAVGMFAGLFARLPRSACAPGYRANDDTHKTWAQHGIRVAQNGTGTLAPPHFNGYGILHLQRSIDFEPAVAAKVSLEECLATADACFARGVPAIVSIHSVNFHSSVRDFRSRTLSLLGQFFQALKAKHPSLLYLHDDDLYKLVDSGAYESAQGTVRVRVTKRLTRIHGAQTEPLGA